MVSVSDLTKQSTNIIGGLSDDPSLAVDRFLDAIWAERGLSTNTLRAYRMDLSALNAHLRNQSSECHYSGYF